MASGSPMSGVSLLWNDKKFLCDVERALERGKRMESRRTSTIPGFLVVVDVESLVLDFPGAFVS